jgi:hypothetical protein
MYACMLYIHMHIHIHTHSLYGGYRKLKWSIDVGGRIEATPTLHGNTLVVSYDLGVTAFDVRHGILTSARELWDVAVGSVYGSPLVISAGDQELSIYVATDKQKCVVDVCVMWPHKYIVCVSLNICIELRTKTIATG